MIERYSRPVMARIWEPQFKLELWLKIELLVLEAQARAGRIPLRAVSSIRRKLRVDVARVEELEKRTRHDVAAFVAHLEEQVGDEARYLHRGLTSSDLLDTTLAVQLKEACGILDQDIERLLAVLKEKALHYKQLPMMGRTHGVHAEPITFGLKLALWYEEMMRNRRRLRAAQEEVSFGKVSGAVGTYSQLGPEVEAFVLRRLGIKPEPVSSQVVQRDRHACLFAAMAIAGTSLEKFATEIRHLQRTEVGEVEEAFGEEQQGSSAMPHKKNPVNSERICGLARIVRGHCLMALEDVPLWHERDISHSSVERVIAPDGTTLLDFMLDDFTRIMEGLVVHPERMRRNMEQSRGVTFSQRIMLMLMDKGLARGDAYRAVQRCALKAWHGRGDFKAALLNDPVVSRHLSAREVERGFDLEGHLRHVDYIFRKVFGGRR